ncbi:MAG: hypothetical protein ACI97A_002008 [Planctomycetota bacterium]|jgi:hypothetical protein
MKNGLLLSLACFALLFTSTSFAQSNEVKKKAAEQDDPIGFAIQWLLGRQENYTPDSPVGTLPDAKLAPWQKGEKQRLKKVFEAAGGKGAEWPYEGVYRIGRKGMIPPGYRVGGTALVCTFLLEAPGFKTDQKRQEAVRRAIDFMLKELKTNKKLEGGPQRGYDVRGWAHTFALDFFLRANQQKIVKTSKRSGQVKKMIKDLLKRLETNEARDGGWNYTGGRSSSFMTGPTLLALYRAKANGFKVNKGLVKRALTALANGRVENGAFAYSGKARKGTKMGASAARSHVAELALLLAGKSEPERMVVAMNGFFKHWDDLLVRKGKQRTHLPPYNIAPYYFYFGHRYAALAIEYVPENERAAMREKLNKLLWKTRSENGSWNDRVFPRTSSFSTAMVGLSFLAQELPKLDQWKKKKL